MTAYEYISKLGGENIEGNILLSLDQYENHVNKYFNKNRRKLSNLLSYDIPEGFISRQLNDSRYISKYIKGLLSNIVREENEKEAIAKNIQPLNGAITSRLKHDWGLNDKWNELIAPRFKRLNKITDSDDYGYFDKTINAFRIQVPDELRKGFSSKRIDHRHHALDAIVIACTTSDHINYITSLETHKENYALKGKLLSKNKEGRYKNYKHPWKTFSADVKASLEKIVISFKQNNRVINKTNNKTWQWVKENGGFKKKLVKQTKGDSWAIRKPLHKETVAGKVHSIKLKAGKIATSNRVLLKEIKNEKILKKIVGDDIKKILRNHLENYINQGGKKDFEAAFNENGVEQLNKNIKHLNNGKERMPIKKVKVYEEGKKFAVGHEGNNSSKYVEAAKGTNLFFAIYWNEKKQKRVFETIPLVEVIAHQKEVAHLPKHERTQIQPNPEKGQFLFTISPNDLVYIPTDDEINNPNLVDFQNLDKDQISRIYKMVSTTQNKLQCIPGYFAKVITTTEIGSNNKSERVLSKLHIEILNEKSNLEMIKTRCWKLHVSRLGKIVKVEKQMN